MHVPCRPPPRSSPRLRGRAGPPRGPLRPRPLPRRLDYASPVHAPRRPARPAARPLPAGARQLRVRHPSRRGLAPGDERGDAVQGRVVHPHARRRPQLVQAPALLLVGAGRLLRPRDHPPRRPSSLRARLDRRRPAGPGAGPAHVRRGTGPGRGGPHRHHLRLGEVRAARHDGRPHGAGTRPRRVRHLARLGGGRPALAARGGSGRRDGLPHQGTGGGGARAPALGRLPPRPQPPAAPLPLDGGGLPPRGCHRPSLVRGLVRSSTAGPSTTSSSSPRTTTASCTPGRSGARPRCSSASWSSRFPGPSSCWAASDRCAPGASRRSSCRSPGWPRCS